MPSWWLLARTVVLSPDSLIREPRYHETCMLRTSDASFFFNPATHGQICGRTRGTICWNTTIHKQGVVLTVRSHACWTPQLYAVTRAMCSLTPPIRWSQWDSFRRTGGTYTTRLVDTGGTNSY
jgi:hypothetical protein